MLLFSIVKYLSSKSQKDLAYREKGFVIFDKFRDLLFFSTFHYSYFTRQVFISMVKMEKQMKELSMKTIPLFILISKLNTDLKNVFLHIKTHLGYFFSFIKIS